jgi:uncharacterized oligopeptide transporter (OPT) family protein
MQLAFPSGYAVANILRALTDKTLLRRSIAKLAGGTAAGGLGGLMPAILAGAGSLGAPGFFRMLGNGFDLTQFSASTVGAGMVVGARVGVPAFVVGLCLTPWLRKNGWIGPRDPIKKIGFIVALGAILGAAAVDMSEIACQAIQRLREKLPAQPQEDWKRTNTHLLILCIRIANSV